MSYSRKSSTMSHGNSADSSISAARGAMRSRASVRTRLRTSRCSSVSGSWPTPVILFVGVVDPDVQMVVVVPEDLDDVRRPGEARVGPHVDDVRTRCHEEVEQCLGETAIHLLGSLRRPLTAVEARVIHVGVEPVLVRGVLRTERPSARAAEVADADTGRPRMGVGVVPENTEDRANEIVGAPSPPG